MPGQAAPTNLYASLRRQLERRAQLVKAFGTVPSYPAPAVAPNAQYVGSTKWTAVAAWASTTAYSVGNLVRQNATPTVGFERVFLCLSAGTSGGSEPLWSTPATAPAYGSNWADGTVLWLEVTGRSAYGWNAPHARLVNALTVPWCAPGDYVYVSNNHAETQATAMTIGSATTGLATSTAALPNVILCVNDAGSVPPVAADLRTTATVTTTGTSNLSIASQFLYVYGIIFSAGDGASSSNINVASSGFTSFIKFESCALRLGHTNAGGRIVLDSGGGIAGVQLVNTTMQFGAVGQGVGCAGRIRWENTPAALTGAIFPTTLFVVSGGTIFPPAAITGVDLSALGSGNLVNVASRQADFYLQDCKLGVGAVPGSGAIASQDALTLTLVNCDSADTNYRYYRQTYQGTVQHETTVVRTGGATDGTTPISRKMVSSANSQYFAPLESDPILYWNESLTSITLTVPVVVETAGGQAPATGLTNRDAWIEVEYPGTSGFPLGVWDLDSKAANFLTSAAAQPLDGTSVWANALSAPVQQSLATTFTPTGKGPIKVKVMLARPSTTLYFDPLLQVA